MASENQLFAVPGLEAGADLSTKQYFFVKKSATDDQCVIADTDGEVVLGVLQNKPNAAGVEAEVMVAGVSKIEAGEALTAGDLIGTDSSGKAKKIEGSITGADVGDFVFGICLVGVASGEVATVLIGFHSHRVEAQ